MARSGMKNGGTEYCFFLHRSCRFPFSFSVWRVDVGGRREMEGRDGEESGLTRTRGVGVV